MIKNYVSFSISSITERIFKLLCATFALLVVVNDYTTSATGGGRCWFDCHLFVVGGFSWHVGE